MTHIIHRSLKSTPLTAVAAQGMYITDQQGRRYIDASGGAAVSCLGHGHPDVLAAMHKQIDQLAYVHTSFFTTEVSETSDTRTGVLVEFDATEKMFSNPADERTEHYVTGRFG